MNEPLVHGVLLSHAAATLYMTGLIWFVQIVHYPLMGSVGQTNFLNYEQQHTTLTSWVVGPPMLLEFLSASLLFWFRPDSVSDGLVWIGFLLLAITWLSTALLQVPCHQKLADGFDTTVHRRLVTTNWIRTVAWSLRGMLALWIL